MMALWVEAVYRTLIDRQLWEAVLLSALWGAAMASPLWLIKRPRRDDER